MPRRAREWTLVVIAAATGAYLAMTLLSATSVTVPPFELGLAARPSLRGVTEVSVPPLGRVRAPIDPRHRPGVETELSPECRQCIVSPHRGIDNEFPREFGRIVSTEDPELTNLSIGDGGESIRIEVIGAGFEIQAESFDCGSVEERDGPTVAGRPIV